MAVVGWRVVLGLNPCPAPAVSSGLAGRQDSDPGICWPSGRLRGGGNHGARRSFHWLLATVPSAHDTPPYSRMPCPAERLEVINTFVFAFEPFLAQEEKHLQQLGLAMGLALGRSLSLNLPPPPTPGVGNDYTRWILGLQGQGVGVEGAEMKGSPAAYQHQRFVNHAAPT